MYVLFGTKFSKMFCGPMWSKEASCQDDGGNTPGSIEDPLKVYKCSLTDYNTPVIFERENFR